MEIGEGGDDFAIVNEVAAALGDGGIEIVDGLEASVCKRFIDERPEMLGRLQFRGIGRLVDQCDAVGKGQVLWRMQPALSSRRMMRPSCPAPTWRAKNSNILAKKALAMPLDMNQSVSPLVGATKPVT